LTFHTKKEIVAVTVTIGASTKSSSDAPDFLKKLEQKNDELGKNICQYLLLSQWFFS
jgi:hypothetical protein